MEKEIQHGKNIISAAADAHAKHPLTRFVLSTLSDSRKWSEGKIKHNLHFDGKAKYTDYLKHSHPDLTTVANYLHIGYYLTNITSIPLLIPQRIAEGEYILPSTNVANGKALPYVHPPNDTGHFVRALTLSPKSPPGTIMVGYCKNISPAEFAALWGETLGVRATVKHITYEDLLEAGVHEWFAAETTDSGKYVSTYGWSGGEEGVKSPKEGGVDVSKLQKVEDWIREQDWSGIGVKAVP